MKHGFWRLLRMKHGTFSTYICSTIFQLLHFSQNLVTLWCIYYTFSKVIPHIIRWLPPCHIFDAGNAFFIEISLSLRFSKKLVFVSESRKTSSTTETKSSGTVDFFVTISSTKSILGVGTASVSYTHLTLPTNREV